MRGNLFYKFFFAIVSILKENIFFLTAIWMLPEIDGVCVCVVTSKPTHALALL